MATLNITVDDTQVARVRAAYGVSTNLELRTAIIQDIKQKVIGYEAGVAFTNAQTAINTAHTNQITATETARTDAATISIT